MVICPGFPHLGQCVGQEGFADTAGPSYAFERIVQEPKDLGVQPRGRFPPVAVNAAPLGKNGPALGNEESRYPSR